MLLALLFVGDSLLGACFISFTHCSVREQAIWNLLKHLQKEEERHALLGVLMASLLVSVSCRCYRHWGYWWCLQHLLLGQRQRTSLFIAQHEAWASCSHQSSFPCHYPQGTPGMAQVDAASQRSNLELREPKFLWWTASKPTWTVLWERYYFYFTQW